MTEEEMTQIIQRAIRNYENRIEMIWDDMLFELEMRHGITEEEVAEHGQL